MGRTVAALALALTASWALAQAPPTLPPYPVVTPEPGAFATPGDVSPIAPLLARDPQPEQPDAGLLLVATGFVVLAGTLAATVGRRLL